MADIITRLLLKTNDFDANLNKAKGSVNQFQGGIANMAKTAGAGIMKFAGTLGIAVGAYEGLNKVISSSQTLSDEYNRTIDGLKGGVDEFFYSIGSGDWTPFLNGLDETIRKAREAYTALDQLGNTKMSYGYFNMKNQAELQDQIAILRDKNSTDAQKKAAKQRVDELLKDQSEIVKQLKIRSTEAMQSLVAQGTGLESPDVSMMSIEKTLRLDVDALGDEKKQKLAKEYADFQAEAERLKQKYTEIEMVQVGGGQNKSMVPMERVDSEKYNKAMAPVLAKYQDAINYNTILVKRSDEWLQNLINIGAESFNAERNYASMIKASNRASQSTTGGSDKDKPAPPPVGSLAALDAEITRQNKKLAEATTMQARAAVQATINELEQQKINLKVVVDQEAFKIKYGEMKGGSLGAPDSIYKALQNNAGNEKQGSFDLRKELKDMKLPKFKSPIKKADINLNEEYAASLNSIGSIMGSLSGTFDGGAASVLQWGASILSTIAQVIPQLLALTAANQTETTSEVAGAAAKTMNAHAKIPFVGIAMGLAGVASIFSVMSQASKFATGGIVPGNSFTGDKVPAWVNSGEMILNSEQQSNLFRMLNSKLYGGLNTGRPTIEPQTGNIAALIAPNEENRKVDISGEWKVKGDTAYLQLHNYMKRTGKKL